MFIPTSIVMPVAHIHTTEENTESEAKGTETVLIREERKDRE